MQQDGLASTDGQGDAVALLSNPVRAWFEATFPEGPTPGQVLAWPSIASGSHTLLIAPTGTGKTLAAFLAVLDLLVREHQGGTLKPGPRCVYVSPLRSLNYDIERNLNAPLEGIAARLDGSDACPIRVGVRTGDTSAYERRKLRDDPPHILITTPESLALLLSHDAWRDRWLGVEYLIVDEVHALAPSKRGADLAVSMERLSAMAQRDPCRVGLSATCRADGSIARFLAGNDRSCRIIEAPPPPGTPSPEFAVASLIQPGEAPHRGLSYRRLLRRLRQVIEAHRTTVIFANTRAFAEKITHDLRSKDAGDLIAAHHSALDASRRREIESGLKSGEIRAVVTSTSLEMGVDIGTADITVQIGLPGGVSRCVQRVGRSGHRRGARSRGLLLAATPAELIGAAITARAARQGRIEPLGAMNVPLDVVCQQLVGMACLGEQSVDATFAIIQRAGPMAGLDRRDFEACLSFLAGDLAAPPGAFEPEPGATPRSTSPRIWRRNGWFGLRNRRVMRWYRCNVGTIASEESVRVIADGAAIGTLEAAYAERLTPGDRIVLDGRALEVRRLESGLVHVNTTVGEPNLPRWTSDRPSLSSELAAELAAFRAQVAHALAIDGPSVVRDRLASEFELSTSSAAVIVELIESQERFSEVPSAVGLLVEESPVPDGMAYVFHTPLHRSACEAMARAVGARLGRRFGRNLTIAVADLGWSIHLHDGDRLDAEDVGRLLDPENLDADVLEGLDRGELMARRFRHVAATGLMVLRNPEPGRRVRVGGLNWVSSRLFPLVRAACPDHPLLRQTRREVLEERLDVPSALRWLASRPTIRFRRLSGLSPFAAAWIEPAAPESLHYESSGDALRRLHARLTASGGAVEPGSRV